MHHSQIGADDVLAEIVQLGIGQGGARQAELDDRHVGGAVAQHQRRRDAGRHVFQHDSELLATCETARPDIGAFMQIDLLDADTLIAGRLDARDVVDQRRHLPLMQRQDAVLHVLRADAVIGPDYADDWDVDLGENVDRHAQRASGAENADEDKRRDDGVRTLEDKGDYLHSALVPIRYGRRHRVDYWPASTKGVGVRT